MLCSNASPVIAHNTFVANMATGADTDHGGGAIFCYDSTALLLRNRFPGHTATASAGVGGAVACVGGSPVVVSNLFVDNLAGIGARCAPALALRELLTTA